MEDTKYYIYAYLDPRSKGKFNFNCLETISFNSIPYYIGLSKHDERKYFHLNEAKISNHKCLKLNLIRKLIKIFGEEEIRNNIVVVRDNLTKEDAFNLEKKLIKVIGRRDLNTGPLVNHTGGGEGTSDCSGKWFYIRAKNASKSLIGARSIYSHTPEFSAKSNSESMKKFYYRNSNKIIDDIPKLSYKRYYSNTTHSWSGSKNGNSKFYYLVISPDGGYHIASKGCLRILAEKLNISYTTLEWSAQQNEARVDGKISRIMRGKGIGHYSLRFKSIKECPIDITIGNQQLRPKLP